MAIYSSKENMGLTDAYHRRVFGHVIHLDWVPKGVLFFYVDTECYHHMIQCIAFVIFTRQISINRTCHISLILAVP